ncbi:MULTISPECIES: proton-translocating transhydrogenase family protein [Holospora]|uniref:proton-translocating NAD(P)(+) transhydrogenase n=2 Tax=Holospora TaxID=44747 RepID=A0A061JG17_9PROT|nr:MULTISPECIES: proton-translocating transhydrogenase family protein [Holospora]ETZ04725.1 NAD(P) transhydrogenase subunit alpha [Holospora undulata HU1]GAJ46451.1 NAD(P) transhydrogenase subunit alpha [Holospora elegans E1]
MDFLMVFMIGIALGYYTVCRVPSIFHAPLMSLTNGVSSICVLILLDQSVKGLPKGIHETGIKILVCITVMMLCLNISGGFDITQKMIKFFYPDEKNQETCSTLKRWSVFLLSSFGGFLSIGVSAFFIKRMHKWITA